MSTENLYDVVIIGGGPAGLTAAIYLARARYRVIVLEKENFGGQITITSEVVNYPGIERTSGRELTAGMRKQAQAFGAEFLLAEATALDFDGDIKTVHTTRSDLKCFGVLLATGAHPRMIGFDGELDYRGRGVAYCATCDGEFFTGKEVFVIGGGFAAAEESVFLTKYATKVTILIRGDDFTCAKTTADETRANKKITVLTNTEVVKVEGDTAVKKIVYKNNVTGEVSEYQNDDGFGVFVFAGYEPATDLIKGLAELDERGYVVTDRQQKTTCDGLYAAGDVCIKNLRQVVTAVGDGALAATELEKYAAAMQKKTGQIPKPPVTRIKIARLQVYKIASDSQSRNLNLNQASHAEEKPAVETSGELFSADIKAQLNTVFAKMENPLTLKLYLDSRAVSKELKAYVEEMAKLTDKLTIEIAEDLDDADKPCVKIFKGNEYTGLAFHGCPGGHEFTSFVLGLYNASGPGQQLDAATLNKIKSINRQVDMKILVALTCTMCPELVTAAQKIAAENPSVTSEVYDINHFAALKEKYNVMSVPCLVEGERVTFGRKNVQQLLEFIL